MSSIFMTPKQAAVALVYHETGRGKPNNSFTTALLNTFQKADLINTSILLSVYPEFNVPMVIAKTEGIKSLEDKIAQGYFDRKWF